MCRNHLPPAPRRGRATQKTPGSPSRHHRPHRLSQLRALDRPSAAAAVTERIRLATDVMLGPLRVNAAMVAKQILSLDTLAGGSRAVLGIGLGAREDDFEISGVERRPAAPGSTAPWGRSARSGTGRASSRRRSAPGRSATAPPYWSEATSRPPSSGRRDSATAGPRAVPAPMRSSKTRRNSTKPGRSTAAEGKPRTMASHFSFGPIAEENARSSLLSYYAWLGDEGAEGIAGSAAKDGRIRSRVSSRTTSRVAATSSLLRLFLHPDQVGLLAEAAGLSCTGSGTSRKAAVRVS